METEKKLAGKTYQAPVMKSVDVELQALLGDSCSSNTPVTSCTCTILNYSSEPCSDGGGGRSREASFWDDED